MYTRKYNACRGKNVTSRLFWNKANFDTLANMAKLLLFGDIFGKPGREGLKKVLPGLKDELQPDVVFANVENLAHGKGVTEPTLLELKELGVDVFTSGNHVFDKLPEAVKGFEKYSELIRPANYGQDLPGKGYYRFSKNGIWFTVINLGGKVFFENQYKGEIANPFLTADKVIEEVSEPDDIIVVDLHAEATSEKNAMGYYLDGRVSVFYGTHTHVPTADNRVLPKGTAYVTDLGMTGPLNSVIGVRKENALQMFLEQGKFVLEPEEKGECVVNAIFVETLGRTAVKIQRIQKII